MKGQNMIDVIECVVVCLLVLSLIINFICIDIPNCGYRSVIIILLLVLWVVCISNSISDMGATEPSEVNILQISKVHTIQNGVIDLNKENTTTLCEELKRFLDPNTNPCNITLTDISKSIEEKKLELKNKQPLESKKEEGFIAKIWNWISHLLD